MRWLGLEERFGGAREKGQGEQDLRGRGGSTSMVSPSTLNLRFSYMLSKLAAWN